MIPRISITATSALLLVLALSACSSAPPAVATSTSRSTDATPEPIAEPTSTPTPEPTATATPPSCETMISPGTVDALTEAGWTAGIKEFYVGGVQLSEGLLCFWADYTVASDHGQLFGWSEISAPDAAKAQAALLADGWQREDGPEGVYITEDARHALGADEDGYGMTYLFGDGWVKLADTKQSLILIEWSG
ncbi:MAG: hypothetical protein WAK00_10910 [Microbacterium sp.]|uniref:hypothetical protein n=1 Tax=Microbacterium sp. TaxID=51671 RepID=UPI003BAFBEBE